MKAKFTIDLDYLKSVLDYNPSTGEFIWSKYMGARAKKGELAGSLDKEGYLIIKIKGKSYKAHRLAFYYVNGWMPDEVDHVDNNGPKSDNRICNLRAATSSKNCINKGIKSTNKSGFKGVHFHSQSNKWRSQICVNGKSKTLGNFSNPEDAYAAYCIAAKKLHGDFARLS